jgi:23S rRNA (cytidine1920-2'-O)/16S rRNA (cytidine1409-2'-O)-methyltransferase
MKERLDKLLVARGLAPTREKALAYILAGQVRVNDAPAAKAGARIDAEARIELAGKDHPYVSRGGVKLAAALDAFGLDPAGRVCMDIGASTGGFTHCLVLRGARRVYAVDVGYGQLAWEVRNHPAVRVLERTNIRHLAPETVGEPIELIVVDVSFIALTTVLGEAVRFLAPGGAIVGLVKPQFEAGREHVRRGGRVTDAAVHDQVLARVRAAGAALGLETQGQIASPILGKKSGNREFLVLWRDRRPAGAPPHRHPRHPRHPARAPAPPMRTDRPEPTKDMRTPPPLPDYRRFSIRHPAALKPLRQAMAYGAVRGLLALASRLSLRQLQGLGRLLGRVAYAVAVRQRRLSHVQLQMALPEVPAAERERIARHCFQHQGMTALETAAMPRLRAGGAPWLSLEGPGLLTAAHARGRGVVLITGHVANWETIPIALERLRIRALAVVSTNADPRIGRLLGDLRRTEWMEIAERGSASSPRQLLTCLRRGDALVLATDVDIEAQGVFVDFFGVPANTPRAAASLALKLDAPVLTYFDIRHPDGTHTIRFREVPVDAAIRQAADPVRALTQAIADQTEAHIRAYPEQWAWNHRRWKRRPPPATGTDRGGGGDQGERDTAG